MPWVVESRILLSKSYHATAPWLALKLRRNVCRAEAKGETSDNASTATELRTRRVFLILSDASRWSKSTRLTVKIQSTVNIIRINLGIICARPGNASESA